jgi:uncharacterized protein (UPF0128 family)
MQVKDKFLEKINLLIIVFILCFSHNLFAENIYEKIFSYNDSLQNSSANFIQTNSKYTQEGKIFFGKKRIKIDYKNPQRLTLILSDKKGMYINHGLKESEFFMTKKSYIKIFFDIFHKESHIKDMTVKHLDKQIEISEKIQLDDIFFNIKLVYENKPIKLRRLEIISDDEKIQMGFFNHKFENIFDKNFFSMIDPYLN